MLRTLTQAAFALIVIPSAYIIFGFVYRYYQRSLKFLRGPPRPSLLFGMMMITFDLLKEVGILETKWFNEYGTAFRTSSCYGSSIISINRDVYHGLDPRAIQYVFHTSGYRFPKGRDSQQVTKMLFGRGIVWAEGEVHNRQRKALNPAFSASQLRQFLDLFQRSTSRLAKKWKEEELFDGPSNGKVINVTHWLPRITLDVIGESAFGYDFGALDGRANELGEIFKHMLCVSLILWRAFRRSIPAPLGDFLCRFPTKTEKRFKEFSTASKKVAKSVFDIASQQTNGEEDLKGSKDVLSVLLRSNMTADPKKALDEDEVLSQMAYVPRQVLTRTTTTWMLYELGKSLKDQSRVYDEIREMRSRIGPDVEPTASDYDSMPFFSAVIKEGLRLHPIVPALIRQAASDDVIPLEFPVISESGEELSQIPVSKGQRISVSISVYNRLTEVWGKDANEWNPERFLHESKKDTTLGVYANLMTFSAGVRACIGWRFALMELQAILFGLLEKFEFSPGPEGLDDIQRVPAGLMIPMKKGHWMDGIQMPLRVKVRD
ncbi:cytochrome P450 [Lentinula lateritia]|uniref:Cytochrome P450 n=1 Tax=Lentinula aff. lateritia TaxID=2804960 RepID=A0ACC1U2W7_9AGAR|nr:cytochrome P450 [Lentinula aff. lateritia]KAJ3851486.1 cytochrome P450 [Lentinula lateritia]